MYIFCNFRASSIFYQVGARISLLPHILPKAARRFYRQLMQSQYSDVTGLINPLVVCAMWQRQRGALLVR